MELVRRPWFPAAFPGFDTDRVVICSGGEVWLSRPDGLIDTLTIVRGAADRAWAAMLYPVLRQSPAALAPHPGLRWLEVLGGAVTVRVPEPDRVELVCEEWRQVFDLAGCPDALDRSPCAVVQFCLARWLGVPTVSYVGQVRLD